MADQPDPLADLKKIADIKFNRERHRLAAVKEELLQLDAERKALNKKIVSLSDTKETSPAALINAQSYLYALGDKAKFLDHARQQASARTQTQRDRIKTALASKIRVDGMSDE